MRHQVTSSWDLTKRNALNLSCHQAMNINRW